MTNLVCIGVGGTGAACVEATLHLAALGFFTDCSLHAALVDADQAHPRNVRVDQFVKRYNELRAAESVPSGWAAGLFGTPVLASRGAQRPSGHSDLFRLLELQNPMPAALARLFFTPEEVSRDGALFANGYYGRTNAGVCFFSDRAAQDGILIPMHESLQGGSVVIFGSIFGGTGAAGMLDLARAIRRDRALQGPAAPSIAIVQLEPYFRPDGSGASLGQGLVNLPETFERRAATTYRFLRYLEETGELPYDALYPLGTPEPAKFPAGAAWFQRDGQDNPPLFLEYLAAMAAQDFLAKGRSLRSAASRTPPVLKRQAPKAPFGPPLNDLRELLFAATYTFAIVDQFVMPLLEKAGERFPLPGHPWIDALLSESQLTLPQLSEHFQRTSGLLREVLERTGVLTRDDPKRELTLASFPDRFLGRQEATHLARDVGAGNPTQLFGDYRLAADGKLPARALLRWVLEAQAIPDSAPAGTVHATQRPHQLSQQEQQPGGTLGLPVWSHDAFEQVPQPVNLLTRLARAGWHEPLDLPAREESELPSVWAPAIAHRSRLTGKSVGNAVQDRLRLVQLGLLWHALMREAEKRVAPVFAFDLNDKKASVGEVFRDALQRTCPLKSSYAEALDLEGRVVAIHQGRGQYAVPGPPYPVADEILGFFYPDTVVVPAAGLTPAQEDQLFQKGRFVVGRGFPAYLRTKCGNWSLVLEESRVPNAREVGPDFERFLDSFPGLGSVANPVGQADALAPPEIPGLARWILRLYV